MLDAIGDFEAVDLDELNRRAALLDREENKYVLDAIDLHRVLTELQGDFHVLEISGRRDFGYDTVYYDTHDHLTYRQHAQGRRQRMKVRSRRYDDSDDLCWFEVKLKGHRGRTVKQRLAYRSDLHGTMTPEAATFVAECAHRHYGVDFAVPLLPALAMTYRRFTLVGRHRAERITIDHDLCFRIGRDATPAPGTTVIVEVKSPDGRGIADELMRAGGRRSEACSKYCVGLNLMAAPVAHNSFNRTLRRHFDWEGSPMTTPTAAPGVPAAAPVLDDELVERVVRLLRPRHPDRADGVLRMAAIAAVSQFSGATIRSYVEVLAYRRADEALRATAACGV